ncbi:class I SAM-dependent methyltransferase [Lachnospiraceae bacterium 54-53]
MELRMKFNEDEANYDNWRPIYVSELFNNIIEYSNLNNTKNVLEIGIGTGQATLPILKTGCNVTAIEIGEKLAEYSKQKFIAYNNFNVVNTDFESFNTDSSTYDLIYSATAFHWIPQEVSYPKVYQLLNSGGVLALFWNHPFVAREDDPLHVSIQKIYAKYRPSLQKPIEHNKEKCLEIINTIKQHGFVDVNLKLYYQTRMFDAKSYISLLNTYSDHRAMQEEEKALFENEIIETINRFNTKLNIYDTMDLYLAKKP